MDLWEWSWSVACRETGVESTFTNLLDLIWSCFLRWRTRSLTTVSMANAYNKDGWFLLSWTVRNWSSSASLRIPTNSSLGTTLISLSLRKDWFQRSQIYRTFNSRPRWCEYVSGLRKRAFLLPSTSSVLYSPWLNHLMTYIDVQPNNGNVMYNHRQGSSNIDSNRRIHNEADEHRKRNLYILDIERDDRANNTPLLV